MRRASMRQASERPPAERPWAEALEEPRLRLAERAQVHWLAQCGAEKPAIQ